MSQSRSGPPGAETGSDNSSADISARPNSPNGRFFLSLRKTAEWHRISPSYLSRRVRAGENAKGHNLSPFVIFEKEKSKKRVFGFSFPGGYEPADSRVDGPSTESAQKSPAESRPAAPGKEELDEPAPRHDDPRDEERYDRNPDGGATETSTDEHSQMKEGFTQLKEDIVELKSTLRSLLGATKEVVDELSELRERQEHVERELAKTTGQMQDWEEEEKEQRRQLRQWLRRRFESLNESRATHGEIVDQQFQHLNERINQLQEWGKTAIEWAQDDLERSRKEDLEDLSSEIKEEIRDPILEILADEDDDHGESHWVKALGLGTVLLVEMIVERRPDLVAQAALAVGGNSATGRAPLSAPTSGRDSTSQDAGSEQG